jgi:tRNA modification GTPase
LADTAGVRDSEDAIERVGVERSLAAARSADLIVWVVDGSDAGTDSLKSLESQWVALGAPSARSFGIQTKMDLPGATGSSFFLGKMEFAACSAVSGKGIHEAAVGLVRASKKWVGRSQGEVILTREEDKRAVEECILHLERALQATEEDLFASDLRQALRSMSALIGDTVPDDILGAIFSGFCIGK